jgi:hypothetical protein
MDAMFAWRLLDAEGHAMRSSDRFGDQALAEAWLSSEWEALANDGVREVELVRSEAGEDETLYRMSLAEA